MKGRDFAMNELEVHGSWRVDVPELSALALRPSHGADSTDLLGVGDSAFSIFVGDTRPPGASRVVADLADSVSRWTMEPREKSQWEGLAADGAGYAFVLQEHPGDETEPSHVFVFGPDLRERVCVIALEVDKGAEWKKDWNADKNARAEALVLLRDAHVLVAKQKDPVRFIEFGPEGASEAGLEPARFLPDGEPFEYPSKPFVRYEPLASWGLARRHRDELTSVNDLAVLEGRLFAVSRASHLIVELEADVTPEEDHLGVERAWRVPADVQHPEGLVLGEGHALVADDLSDDEDRGGPNIFLLSAFVWG
jgi:hypothetical protein